MIKDLSIRIYRSIDLESISLSGLLALICGLVMLSKIKNTEQASDIRLIAFATMISASPSIFMAIFRIPPKDIRDTTLVEYCVWNILFCLILPFALITLITMIVTVLGLF